MDYRTPITPQPEETHVNTDGFIGAIKVTIYGATITPQNQRGVALCTNRAIIRHDVCGGFVDILPVSPTHFAVACRHCNMHLPFPCTVTTYAEMQKWFERALTPQTPRKQRRHNARKPAMDGLT